jgi:DNA-binding winged helix-turn-helix (wHTH) protein
VETPEVVAFGRLRLDVKRRVLISPYGERSLRDRVFRLLMVFLESNGSLVTDEILYDRVWAGKPVKRSNLDMHIYLLRQLLAECDSTTEYIVTINKKGRVFACAPTMHGAPPGLTENERSDQTSALAHCLDGYCLLEQRSGNTLRAAAQAFTQALDVDPGFTPAYLGLARVYVALGLFGDIPAPIALAHARTNHNRALVGGGDSAEVSAVYADIEMLLNWDCEKAHQHITNALLRDRYSPSVRSVWVRHLLCTGEFDAALYESIAMLRSFPQDTSLRILFANVLLMRGDTAGAIDALTRAMFIEPENLVALLYLAQAYVLDGTPMRAVTALTGEGRPVSDRELPWLSRAYAEADDRESSSRVYDDCVQDRRPKGVSSFALAVAAAGLRKKKEAIALLRLSFEEREPAAIYLRGAPSAHWFETLEGSLEFEELKNQLPSVPAKGDSRASA